MGEAAASCAAAPDLVSCKPNTTNETESGRFNKQYLWVIYIHIHMQNNINREFSLCKIGSSFSCISE